VINKNEIKARVLSQIPKKLISKTFYLDKAHLKFSTNEKTLINKLIKLEKSTDDSLIDMMGESMFRWELSKDILTFFNIDEMIEFIN